MVTPSVPERETTPSRTSSDAIEKKHVAEIHGGVRACVAEYDIGGANVDEVWKVMPKHTSGNTWCGVATSAICKFVSEAV